MFKSVATGIDRQTHENKTILEIPISDEGHYFRMVIQKGKVEMTVDNPHDSMLYRQRFPHAERI